MNAIHRLRRLSYWSPVRFAVQTAAAALITFGLVYSFGIGELSWGVVSALFAVQWSLDSSIEIAFGRIAGAVIGSVIGLLCVLFIGADGFDTIISLSVAVVVMSFIAGLRPSLYYGLFAAAAMIVDPGGDVVENAAERALAISIGTAVGALSATLILPMPAHRSAEEHLGRAVQRCGDLLVENINALIDRKDYDLPSIHQNIRAELYMAQSSVSQSKFARKLDRRLYRPSPEVLLRTVQRLWHSFVLIDRVKEHPLAQEIPSDTASDLKATAKAVRDYLSDLGDAIINNTSAQPPKRALLRLTRMARELEDIASERSAHLHSRFEVERLHTPSIVLLELAQSIDELARSLGVDPAEGKEDEEGALT